MTVSSLGLQFTNVAQLSSVGLQFVGKIEGQRAVGLQMKESPLLHKVEPVFPPRPGQPLLPRYSVGLGLEFFGVSTNSLGLQVQVIKYNTDYLRIFSDFVSRGSDGQTWTSNSTQEGDFSPNNLNNDIVENYWRTSDGVRSNVILDCDTGIPQGAVVDTLYIGGHNLSRQAQVFLVGSDNSNHTPSGAVHRVAWNPENIYWLAPSLPTRSYRYWRIQINDPLNTEGFLKVGVVVFGRSDIFDTQPFTDNVTRETRDYADTVVTEGFTSVANSRALKRRVSLEFVNLAYDSANYLILENIFRRYRTIAKCLWIPTPSAKNPRITDRFAVFGKLTQVPLEQHNSRGASADYVSLSVEIDEAL